MYKIPTALGWLLKPRINIMITLTQITQLALIGTPEATAQAKVLFDLLNAKPAQAFDETAQAIDKLKATKDLSYAEKVAQHTASKKNGVKTTKTTKKAPKTKKGEVSKGSKGKASQERNNHSKAKIAAYKAKKTVPQVIIEWFGKKKSFKTIQEIADGTGLSNKEVGDTCWGQVNKKIMKADKKNPGVYKMA